MKKVISTFSASIMAVSALSVYSASATVDENTLSIDTEVLTEGCITANGAVIPAGSTAVTVKIADNTGFDSSLTTLNINSAELIVDSNGNPIYTAGNVLEDSMIASATKNNLISFSSASAEEINSDGEMITFYVSSGFTGASIVNELILCSADVDEYAVSTASTLYSYYIGDTTQDYVINITDASEVLRAESIFNSKYKTSSNPELTVNFAATHKSELLPNALVAEAADTDLNNIINTIDAQNILQYYSNLSAGFENPSVACVGVEVIIIVA